MLKDHGVRAHAEGLKQTRMPRKNKELLYRHVRTKGWLILIQLVLSCAQDPTAKDTKHQ